MSDTLQDQEQEYTFHSLANAFPLMTKPKLDELTEDIRKNGLLEHITATADRQIIDGRHRYLACKTLGIQPKIEILPPATDLAVLESLITSKNIHRRHESEKDLEATYLRFLAEGKSIRKIAAEEGKSKSEIGRIVKKAKAKAKSQEDPAITIYRGGLSGGGSSGKSVIPDTDPHLTDARRQSIHKDLEQSKTIKETARQNKVSETTVKREKKKLGLRGRGNGGASNGKAKSILLSRDQEKEIAAYYKAEQLVTHARRYKLTKKQGTEIARRIMRDEHPAEMIEHLRSVYSSENKKKFMDSCDDYGLSPKARNAIENYLEKEHSYESINGNAMLPDIKSLQLVFSDLSEEILSKFQYLGEMTKENASRVLSLHAFVLDLAPLIKQLDEYLLPITNSEPLEGAITHQPEPAEAEAELVGV